MPYNRRSITKMSGNLTNSIFDFIITLFSDQVTASNSLNPAHLAIATKGYWIQLSLLGIPDQYGFFSRGPPRLQVFQGFYLTIICIWMICVICSGAFLAFIVSMNPNHEPIWKLILFMMTCTIGILALIWVEQCLHDRRSPDYVWEDWKARQE